jgi:hypothetical protein
VSESSVVVAEARWQFWNPKEGEIPSRGRWKSIVGNSQQNTAAVDTSYRDVDMYNAVTSSLLKLIIQTPSMPIPSRENIQTKINELLNFLLQIKYIGLMNITQYISMVKAATFILGT